MNDMLFFLSWLIILLAELIAIDYFLFGGFLLGTWRLRDGFKDYTPGEWDSIKAAASAADWTVVIPKGRP